MEEKLNEIILVNKFYIGRKSYRILLNLNKLIWEREDKQSSKTEISIKDIIAVNVLYKFPANSEPTYPVGSPSRNDSEFINSAFDENEFGFDSKSDEEKDKQCGGSGECSENLSQYQEPVGSGLFSDRQSTRSSIFEPALSPLSSSNLNSCQNDSTNANVPQYLEIIYAAKKISKTKQNFWRQKKMKFQSSSPAIIQRWNDSLKKMLAAQKRPRRILLFVNPIGGEKRGLKVYETICKPLFRKANIDVECVLTQRKNQIFDTLLRRNLSNFDGICCLGGDGTFAECFNGVLFRTLKDFGLDPKNPKFLVKPKIPIGVIPGGSTDTIAFCCHGTSDVETACLHIILGQKRGLDLASIWNRDGLMRFYCSVMSYGFLGDVAKESEELRWMGPKRYEYSGFKKFFSNKSYYGEIFLCPETACENSNPGNSPQNHSESSNSAQSAESSTSSSNKPTLPSQNNLNTQSAISNQYSIFPDRVSSMPNESSFRNANSNKSLNASSASVESIAGTKLEKCFVNCMRCINSASSLTNLDFQQKAESIKSLVKSVSMENVNRKLDQNHNYYPLNDNLDIKLRKILNSPASTPQCDEENTPENRTPTDSNENSPDCSKEVNGNSLQYPEFDEISLQSQSNENFWKLIKGNFFFISIPNISCACNRSPQGLSQFSHLGDGCVDVILVRHTSFFNNLKLLIEISSPNGNINNLPFVESYRTRKVLFRGTKSNLSDVPQETGNTMSSNQNATNQNATNQETGGQQNNDTSQWNCDGEIILDSDVVINSHCQLIDVFMRGPYPIDDEAETTKCCY